MPSVPVEITEWVDDYQPGIVRCELRDAWGNTWSFVEKLPYLTAADLWKDSAYPQPGSIECCEIRRWHDDNGREIVTIDTDVFGIAAESGETKFDVLARVLLPTCGGA